MPQPAAPMNRLDLTRRLLARAGDTPIVAALGNASFDLYTAGDHPQNFYTLGSMGLGSSIGLGLALAQPARKIIVLEGEGGVLMNLGALATIGARQPKNYALIVWDNGQFQITGGQPIASGRSADLVAIARGAGIERAFAPADEAEFEALVDRALAEDGPWVIVARIDGQGAAGRHRADPTWIKHRFMDALGTTG